MIEADRALALSLAGIAITWVAWWAVAFRGISVWRVMPWSLALLGAAALAFGDLAWWGTPDVATALDLGQGWGRALGVGVAAGLALFGATRLAIVPFSRWGRFRADAERTYAREGGRSMGSMLVLSMLSAGSEELFWRGWAQPAFAEAWPTSLTAALIASVVVYVVANLPSRSLVIAVGAVVGGGVWMLLAAATGGVLAPLACHILWTCSMIAFPPWFEQA